MDSLESSPDVRASLLPVVTQLRDVRRLPTIDHQYQYHVLGARMCEPLMYCSLGLRIPVYFPLLGD